MIQINAADSPAAIATAQGTAIDAVDRIVEAATLTARVVTVIFHANGGYVQPESVNTGADGKLASLPTPTREGYSFFGRCMENGTAVTADMVFTRDTTIYARWQEESTKGNVIDRDTYLFLITMLNSMKFKITASASEGGTITPAGVTTVRINRRDDMGDIRRDNSWIW